MESGIAELVARGGRRVVAIEVDQGFPAFTPVPLLAEYATAGTRFRS